MTVAIVIAGFAIAALIVGRAIAQLYRRYRRWSKVRVEKDMMHWVPLQVDKPEFRGQSEIEDGDDDIMEEVRSRAQQNGHFSEKQRS